MAELKYNSGNIISTEVHSIGVIALGSHLENHGACLPIDTDAKIASYVALKSSLNTGSKFLGVIYSAGEFNYIDHGKHNTYKELADDIFKTLNLAKKRLNINKVVIVNGHGGNTPILEFIPEIEESLDIKIVFNNKLIEIEGPHAGDGELSMGKLLGICNEKKAEDHINLKKHGEVGLHKFKKARKLHPDIDEGAKIIEKKGVNINIDYGKELIELAITDVVSDIKKILEK